MKNLCILLLMLCTATSLLAQDISRAEALQLLSRNQKDLGLSGEDLQNSIVSNAFYNKSSGTQMIYLQQSFKGLPVFNQLQTLAFKNGKLVSKAGSRLSSIQKLTARLGAVPKVEAVTALKTTLADKKINPKAPLNGTARGRKQDFGKAGVSDVNMTTELMWVPLNDGADIRLAWQVYLAPSSGADYWLINVDAHSNEIIGEVNLTVYCDYHPGETVSPAEKNGGSDHASQHYAAPQSTTQLLSPSLVNAASYRVIPFPAESPNHIGGAPALRTDPWNLAPGNATSLKWHSNGSTDFNISRGNNVWAREDRTGTTSIDRPTLSATSTTGPDPLSFDFMPDFTLPPTEAAVVPNQQFNITNLFYWNNIIHDLSYQYGFDEASGNFQQNNLGRGGLGNDYVDAQAQDGGGTSNANFSTPADGGNGRMQMYLWNGNPQRDGDVDNGVIVHEFAHGISSRLAGGAAQAACLGSAEQMGEGWSDYYALMATQDWATATLTDGFDKPRGIGTYVVGQTPTGNGIRSQRYTTDFAINNKTYATTIPGNGQQHSRGELWCATLWDMTWNIINQVGSINPNIFNANAAGGNSIALRLVTEGLKLQVCNAGFIDGRNGILQADLILYNGAYRCAIMNAFARRGMGFDASQGSANSTTDQVPGFSIIEAQLSLTQNLAQQQENLDVIYRNRVSAGTCGALTNYLLTDTLPSNVTYVSGGNYNASNRVVSFAVNLAAGQSQDYTFTVKINNGSWFPVTNLLDEPVATGVIPANFTTASISSDNFVASNAQSQSAAFAFFGINPTNVSNFSLATNTPIALGAAPPILSFWHNYNTEEGWDGGIVEISTNGGTSWQDLGPQMTENAYNSGLGLGSGNPLGGRSAFSGNSNGFIKTSVSLLPYANQNALFRFSFSSDDNTAEIGWYLDDILLQSRPLVNMRSSLFNASGGRVAVKDTSTGILQNATCAPGSISVQPANKATCAGTSVSFAATATGSALNYQWQQSVDGGTSFSNVAGATSPTLTIASPALSQNGRLFRVMITGTCTTAFVSTAALLTVTQPIVINAQPIAAAACAGVTVNFSVQASGPALSYQWQVSETGTNFTSISNDAQYAGVTTSTLILNNITTGLSGYQYRVVVNGTACTGVTSSPALLTVFALPVVTINAPPVVNVTPYQPIVLGSSTSPSGVYTYNWLRNGSLLPGANSSSLPVNVDGLGSFQLRATDGRGCSNSSNLVTVADSASKILFIYPNPNNGQFQVRFYQATNTTGMRTLNIYNVRGQKIFSKQYNITSSGYQRMDVNLGFPASAGIYFADLRDNAGKRLASAPIRIQ